mmetsp:Transcript_6817/g.18813  ORF Transcript_6817/g.18813 Transcript_6817/m.18813 type:complete len:319 (-) Transcript_6817:135-1091(-)
MQSQEPYGRNRPHPPTQDAQTGDRNGQRCATSYGRGALMGVMCPSVKTCLLWRPTHPGARAVTPQSGAPHPQLLGTPCEHPAPADAQQTPVRKLARHRGSVRTEVYWKQTMGTRTRRCSKMRMETPLIGCGLRNPQHRNHCLSNCSPRILPGQIGELYAEGLRSPRMRPPQRQASGPPGSFDRRKPNEMRNADPGRLALAARSRPPKELRGALPATTPELLGSGRCLLTDPKVLRRMMPHSPMIVKGKRCLYPPNKGSPGLSCRIQSRGLHRPPTAHAAESHEGGWRPWHDKGAPRSDPGDNYLDASRLPSPAHPHRP